MTKISIFMLSSCCNTKSCSKLVCTNVYAQMRTIRGDMMWLCGFDKVSSIIHYFE